MRVTILLFAQLAERAGTRQLELDVPEGAIVADALAALEANVPQLSEIDPSVAIAVDEQYVPRSRTLQSGQTVALIPPVSGG